MACRKMISHRNLFKQISNTPSPFPSHLSRRLLYVNPHKPVPIQVPVPPYMFPALPISDELLDQIRIRSLNPFKEEKQKQNNGMTINKVKIKKLIRGAKMEAVQERFRSTTRSCVSYDEFLDVCEDVSEGDEQNARDLAHAMDESGRVMFLGDVVFLRPEMVAKVIRNMIPASIKQNDPKKEELRQMERQKICIDAEAVASVRRELWAGLGLLAVQTIGFMRLTFWELSWDVMEPVCFFVTSFYFMAGYTFFMRTSKDPSFEGFFQSRFATKQKKLMQNHNFDLDRYNRLKRDLGDYIPDRLTDVSCDFSHWSSLISQTCEQ